MFHPEKLPSAIERYWKEVGRVRSVIDLHLSRQAGEKQGEKVTDKDVWLVGDKCTVADLSFFIWDQIVDFNMAKAGSLIEKVSTAHIFEKIVPCFMC